jgi:hypothetical protein
MDWRSLHRHLFACRSTASCCCGCLQFWGSVFNRNVLEAPPCVPLGAPSLVPAWGLDWPPFSLSAWGLDWPPLHRFAWRDRVTSTWSNWLWLNRQRCWMGHLLWQCNTHLHLLQQLMTLLLLTHVLTEIKHSTTDKIQHILYSNRNQQSWVELINPTFLLHNFWFYRSTTEFLVLWIWQCYYFLFHSYETYVSRFCTY